MDILQLLIRSREKHLITTIVVVGMAFPLVFPSKLLYSAQTHFFIIIIIINWLTDSLID